MEFEYTLQGNTIEKVSHMKDVGVISESKI